MHKTFYASGFLYHLASQQILLQQNTSSQYFSSHWLLFEKTYTGNEIPETIFKNMISDVLRIKINDVHPVYAYEHENTNKTVFYSKLDSLQDFPSKNGLLFKWFSFRDVRSLHIIEQTKHDIVVGQRVIDAELRKDRGEHTFQ
jgi:hypothetical protein